VRSRTPLPLPRVRAAGARRSTMVETPPRRGAGCDRAPRKRPRRDLPSRPAPRVSTAACSRPPRRRRRRSAGHYARLQSRASRPRLPRIPRGRRGRACEYRRSDRRLRRWRRPTPTRLPHRRRGRTRTRPRRTRHVLRPTAPPASTLPRATPGRRPRSRQPRWLPGAEPGADSRDHAHAGSSHQFSPGDSIDRVIMSRFENTPQPARPTCRTAHALRVGAHRQDSRPVGRSEEGDRTEGTP